MDLLLPVEIKGLNLNLFLILFAFLMLVGVGMAWSSSNKNGKISFSILVSSFFLVYLCLIGFVLPKVDSYSGQLFKSFAKNIGKDVEIATYKIIKPSITFYSKRKVRKINSLNTLQNKLNQDEKFAFVAKKKDLKNNLLENLYLWGDDSKFIIYTNFPVSK
jgi:hypothetical protein